MWNANPAKDRGSRMIRRLFNIACALSLILCAAAAVLWVRSYWRHDSLDWSGALIHGVHLESDEGSLHLYVWRTFQQPAVHQSAAMPLIQTDPHPFQVYPSVHNLHELYWLRRVDVFNEDWLLEFPHWPLCLICAIPFGCTLLTRTFRKPAPAYACRRCGYDLRASADRCPECGMAVPQRTEATQ